MTAETLVLSNFRCYGEAAFEFSPEINIIHGLNGTGKTSILEALGYFATGRSFRRSKDAETVRFGAGHAKICMTGISGGNAFKMGIQYLGTGRLKKQELNGQEVSSPRELLGIVTCVLFSPEDNQLIKDGPGERRRFLDIALAQLKPKYVKELSLYRRLCEEKTVLLRRAEEKPSFLELLPEYNRRIADKGAYLAAERAAFIGELSPFAAAHHSAVSGGRETLALEYKTHALNAEETLAHLEERLPAERARLSCLVGCHKDEVDILIGGRPVRDYGSQGQVRTAALALKLAQRDVFTARLGEEPVLLLDDVLSELDAGRREYILENLRGGQVFITSCEPGELGKGKALCIST